MMIVTVLAAFSLLVTTHYSTLVEVWTVLSASKVAETSSDKPCARQSQIAAVAWAAFYLLQNLRCS